jgi:hypothetical protein
MPGTRKVVAAVLAIAFAVLLPAAVTSAWIRGTVLSTTGYVAAVAPVGADPVVRSAVRTVTEEEIGPLADQAAAAVLPPALAFLARPVSGGLASVVAGSIKSFMAGPQFQRLWVDASQSAHSELIDVLDGNSAAVTTANGQVVLSLAPIISAILKEIAGRLSALTGKAISPPAISVIPAAACRQIASLTHTRLRADCGQIPVLPAAPLTSARRAFRVLTDGTSALLTLAPLTAAAALAVSPRRRGTLPQMAVGGALTVVAMVIAMACLQSVLLARAQPRWEPVSAAIVHALTNRLFTLATWCAIGTLAVAIVALLTGPYRWAAAIRATVRLRRELRQ